MKTFGSVIVSSFLVLLLLVTPVIGSSDWVEYGKSKDENVGYYKKGNIDEDGGKYIVQVWEKMLFSEKGRKKEIQERRKNGLSTKGYDKLSYYIYLHKIDCKNQRRKLLSIIYYDRDSNVIYTKSFDEQKIDYDYIPPDSNLDILRQNVCE